MKYEIEINGDIASWSYSKQYVRDKLSSYGGKHVNLRIASLGGSVFHALDIRQQLIDHGDVTAYLFGPVASSATIIAMGAQKVCMSRCALFLIHKVSNWVDTWGYFNADQLAELIKDLEKNIEDNNKYDQVLVAMYCQKTGKSAQEIKDLLAKSKWLTAAEAKEWGFVDEIIEDGEKIQSDKMNAVFELRGFPSMPEGYNQEDKEAKLFGRLKNYVDSLFGKDNNHTNNKKMNKNYVKVNTLLNVQGVEVDDKKNVILTEDNIKVIDDRLTALENEKSALEDEKSKWEDEKKTLQDEIDSYKNQVEDLKKKPGDKTDKVEAEEDKIDYCGLFITPMM